MDNFDRRFGMMNRIFFTVFFVCLIAIVCAWILTGILGYNILTNPEGVGEYLGKILNGIKSAK